jgi:predicted secreted protein
MPWIMTESPLAIITVFEDGDVTGVKSRAPAGTAINEMPIMNRHAHQIVQFNGFFVMTHFLYVYVVGFHEKNLLRYSGTGGSQRRKS